MLRAVVSRETYHRKEPYAGRARLMTEHTLVLDCGHEITVTGIEGRLAQRWDCRRCEAAA